MKYLTDKEPIGLYLHIPFCKKRCAYCSFYSSFDSEELKDEYTKRLITVIRERGGKISRPVNTIYFGGGTPSLMYERLIPVMQAVRESFLVERNAEITLEINPDGASERILTAAAEAGINRLSVGAQSGSDKMLSLLGRTHTAADTRRTVENARKLGFKNISADIMIALPGSDTESLKNDIDFVCGLEPQHISAYILKTEENTLFYKKASQLDMPDDDSAADQYLYLCHTLEDRGFNHYEISNFCLDGTESRHNLKYWGCFEYLGIGPSAHSFLNGKRFYYPDDLRGFLRGAEPVPDGDGGDPEEYIMLSLRLGSGLKFDGYRRRFGKELPEKIINAAKPLEKIGLCRITKSAILLTDKGMAVSNSIITELLENME